MKNPGPIHAQSKDYMHISLYAEHLAHRFGIAKAAALGQLIKLDDCMRKAADSPMKMSALNIEVVQTEVVDGAVHK